jgi:hypothetical protein
MRNESNNEKRICITYDALFTDFEVVISARLRVDFHDRFE